MTIKVNADKAIYESSVWEGTTLRINGVVVVPGYPVFIDRARVNTLEMEVPPGFATELRLGLGSAGDLTFKASPGFRASVKAPFVWEISPDDTSKSGCIELVFYSTDVMKPWSLVCFVMSVNLADEADFVLTPRQMSLPTIYLRKSAPQHISLNYRQGSPLKGYPLELEITVLTALDPEDVEVNRTGPHDWTFTVSKQLGTFKVDLKGVGFTTGKTLNGQMIPS